MQGLSAAQDTHNVIEQQGHQIKERLDDAATANISTRSESYAILTPISQTYCGVGQHRFYWPADA